MSCWPCLPCPLPSLVQEVRSLLGSVAHCLHLLAAVGARLPEPELQAACAFLRLHQRQLSYKQVQSLRYAFDAWQYEGHGLKDRLDRPRWQPLAINAGSADDAAEMVMQQ